MAGEVYYEVALIPQREVKKENIDYYMGKDTTQENEIIREYYPDRIITKSVDYLSIPDIPFLTYKITEEEFLQLSKNPDVYVVEPAPGPPEFGPLSGSPSPGPLSVQTNNFNTNLRWDYSGDFNGGVFDDTSPALNWGLQWHTQYKTNIDWLKTKSLVSSSTPSSYTFYNEDYTYNLDGSGVDLIIVDSGIDHNHPEFLNENGNTRVVLYDWSQLIGDVLLAELGSSSLPPRYYDTSIVYPHGTAVASVAAGNLNGWAKKATIYDLKSGEYYGDDGFYSKGISLTGAYTAIKRFHESKSINPSTGVKRPTIVNMSYGHFINTLTRRYDGASLTITGLRDLLYKGTTSLSSSLGWSGNDNLPGSEYQIRSQKYETYDDSYPFTTYFQHEYNSYRLLISGCLAAGVIMITAAGNTNEIIVRSTDSDIYNSVIVPGSGTSLSTYFGPARRGWMYPNRAGSPKEEPNVIVVGSLSQHMAIPKSIITNSLSPSFGCKQFDIFGPIKWWWYTNNFDIPSASYDHGDIINFTIPSGSPGFKLGYGKNEVFPGWDIAYASASLVASGFTVVGPVVEIFAAGENLPVALSANVTSGGTYSSLYNSSYPRPYSLYNKKYEGTIWKMGIMNGTSFSSPQVAGVACLYFQINPSATVTDFRNFLEHYAPTDPRMRVFTPDPENRIEFTGSVPAGNANSRYNATRDIVLYGASTKILHWPFTKVNPLTIS